MATPVSPLVSVAWLRQQLTEGATNIRLLACEFPFTNTKGGYQVYLKQHIPGARFYDMNKCIRPRPTCARNLPEAGEFGEYVRSLGVNSHSHVVLYDSEIISSSTKIWWTFRVFGHTSVSVLDGGMMAWKAAGYDVTSGEDTTTITPGDFSVSLTRRLVTEFDEMVGIVRDKSAQIVDCRMENHFAGEEPEPCIYVKGGLESKDMPVPATMHRGHMLGAANIFMFKFLDDTLKFLPKDKLREVFAENGVDVTKPLVSTCYMGHTASIVNMAAYLCGYPDTSLYYGSWTEFGQLSPAELVSRPSDTKL